jgi:hypothetical protein
MAYQKLQASRATEVAPNDNNHIQSVSGGTNNGCTIYIGAPGNIRVKTSGGDDVTFVGVYAGQFLPVNVVQVFSTDTTAGDILALW